MKDQLTLRIDFLSGKYCFKRDISDAHPLPFFITVYQMPAAKKYSPRGRKRGQTKAKLIYFSEI